jgi:hypothetical protein
MHTSGIITSTYIEITQNNFNKIKWNNKSHGRQWELKQLHFWLEIRQLKAIANVKMINIYVPHDRVPIVQEQEVFGVISRW